MEKIIEELKTGINVRGNLSELRKRVNEEGEAEMLLSSFSVENLTDYLLNEDPKTRKNAALLLGDLAAGEKGFYKKESAQEVAQKLISAYFAESTLFVKGSYLKALKNFDCEPYRDRLNERLKEIREYIPEENEKKHIAEEEHALDELLECNEKTAHHKFTGYDMKQEVVLVTNPMYFEQLSKELHGIKAKKHPFGMIVLSENLRQFMPLRYYRELLFPLKTDDIFIEDGFEKMADKLIKAGLYTKTAERHETKNTEETFRFRLEIKGLGVEDEGKFIRRLAGELEQQSRFSLKNSAGDYEFIIRLVISKNGKAHTFLKYLTIPDKRFAYRKNVVASSIHPANAGLFMKLAEPYLKEDAQVMDPCCGVGTMLAERNAIKPIREAYGIDIFGEAVEKAKENMELAGLRVNFIHRDYRDFTHDYPFDEVIADMPVRGKKSKEEQDKLYEGFFKKSAEILLDNGIMILYSNEKSFIFKQLRLMKCFELVKEFPIREKDGYSLYVIRYKRAGF